MQDPTADAALGLHAERDDRSEFTKLLDHMRHAPFEQQREFWAAIRDTVAPISDETESDQERSTRLRKATPIKSLVYYLRFGDRVKIGFTTNLPARLHSLPHDEVLATEPGTIQDERARHAAFADLRVTGEWFRYEEPLRSHIAGLQ